MKRKFEMATYQFSNHGIRMNSSGDGIEVFDKNTHGNPIVQTYSLLQSGNNYLKVALNEMSTNIWEFEFDVVQSTAQGGQMNALINLEVTYPNLAKTLTIRGDDAIRPSQYFHLSDRGATGYMFSLGGVNNEILRWL